jgi:hypothetical protein
MNQFEYVPGLIEQVQKDVGFSNQTGFFETAIYESQNTVQQKILWIDVFYSETAVAEVRKFVQALNQSELEGIRFRMIPDDSFRLVSFPAFLSPVAILLADEDYIEKKYLESWYRCKKNQYKVLWLYNFTDDARLEREITLRTGRLEKFCYKKVELAAGTQGLQDEIAATLTPAEKDTCLKLGIAQTLEPLFEMMKEIVARENNILQTRKLANSFDSHIIRKEETQNTQTEILNFTKQVLQKNLGELERSFRQKYDDLNKPNIGFFAVATNSFAGQITTLQYEELAEKSEKFQTTLATPIVETFLEENETNLDREFNKDRNYADTIITDSIKKINIFLQDKLKTTIQSDLSGIPLATNARILKSSNYIQRAYQGETTKKGAMEYFVALRDYTGLMMVVVGLLAPLNMIASASDGTFGGPFAAFLKSIATWVKLGTAVITAALIAYGIHDLRKRIPRKRKEETDREISKAKENIVQEGKRIYSEASREWLQHLTLWIKDVANHISMEVDRLLKSSSDKRIQQLSHERNNQTKNQQSIENALRNIQNAERTLSTATGKFLELKQSLKITK